jgi:hypothetical protein
LMVHTVLRRLSHRTSAHKKREALPWRSAPPVCDIPLALRMRRFFAVGCRGESRHTVFLRRVLGRASRNSSTTSSWLCAWLSSYQPSS